MNFLGSRILTDNSVAFRVWAPLASSVTVVGDFNNWNEDELHLTAVSGGYWEGLANNLKENDIYKFIITRSDGTSKYRIDPATRDTIDSETENAINHSIVIRTDFPWSPSVPPSFDNLLIYQCHIGSFCGRNDGLSRANSIATFGDNILKLDYIKALGFNAIEILPVQEFRGDRSWGYNPSFYYALASAYGKPGDLRNYVNECHKRGLAVIFDVVYNHISNIDSSFWHFDDGTVNSYLSTFETPWGLSPAFWQEGIKNFFRLNMDMYFNEYNADGLRFDATRFIEANHGLGNDGWEFMQFLTYQSRENHFGKYLIAEHVPSHDSIISSAGFDATWYRSAYDSFVRAMNGIDPVENIQSCLGLNFGEGNSYSGSSNLIKYLMGSHDECGDINEGKDGHRYFNEQFGGRDNWYARAKSRMAWAVNVTSMCNPMMFMGNECHMPGYWDDGADINGDHRFDWSKAGDSIAMPMRNMVSAVNNIRLAHQALQNGFLELTHSDFDNNIIGYKRWNNEGDLILIVVNAGDNSFTGYSYGVKTTQDGSWQQIFCSQDSDFGGWDGAGNAFYEPSTSGDGLVYINVPMWSVLFFKLL
jgi:1,4-alpha-glucan branching enzyme